MGIAALNPNPKACRSPKFVLIFKHHVGAKYIAKILVPVSNIIKVQKAALIRESIVESELSQSVIYIINKI